MSEPKPLNPTEQDALVKQIGLTLMRAAPEDWRQVVAEYRATGRYFELAAELKLADGSVHGWAPPQDVAALFARLRAGMHREGRGSWSNARYQLDHPSSYNLDFDRAEPKWQTPPPQQAYVDEMRFFPRAEENVPDWLRRRLGPPPQQKPPSPQRGFRTARVFDGAGPNGRPSVNRPPVPEHELQQLLDYLDDAPVAVTGRGFDADVLAADAPQVVPAGFQTDGHWIWPAAVSYYLRVYGVPPEADLVERARSADFELPEVPEDARLAAAANLGAPAAPPGTQLPVAVLPVAEPEEPEEQPTETGATEMFEPVEVEPEPEPMDEDTSPEELTETVEDLVEPEQEPEELTDRTVMVEPGEDTANLPAVDEPQGPPYRVTFDEDGIPAQADDRRLRDTYMDGMDLFAPHADERPRPEAAQDTMAWSPDQADDTAEQGIVQDTMAWSPDQAEERPQPDPVEDTMAWSPEQVEERPRPDAVQDTMAWSPEETEERPRADAVQDTMAWSPEQTEERPRPDAVQDTMAWSPEQADDTAEQGVVQDTMAWSPEQTEERPQPDPVQDTMAWSPVLDEPEAEPETDAELTEEHPVVEADEPDLAEPDLIPSTGHFDVAADLRDHTTEFDAVVDEQPEPEPEPEPRQVTSDEETKIVGARRALDDLAVPPGAYRIGGEPADRTWHVRLDGDAWEVAWFDHGPKHAHRFDRVEDASAYLIGKLVLGNFRNVPRPPPPRPPATNGFREEPRRPVMPPRPPEPVAPVPPPVRQEEQPAKRSWPISPMSGEPPLTLFRHKQMFELPAGTEIDRYGDPTGNLAYVAGTPFPERSLVPSWIKRTYRVYRLRRPVEVLTGVAVPWFEQPGGGTAYLFPKSLEDMVADGALVEITADVHSMPKQ